MHLVGIFLGLGEVKGPGVGLESKKRSPTGETRLRLESKRGVPPHIGVFKVIRCSWLPSCCQHLHDDDNADSLTLFERCVARTQTRPVGPRPSLESGVTSKSRLQLLCSPKTGWCAQRPGVDALRVSASSRAVPAALLQCHPAAILGTVGSASEAPRLTPAHFPCPSPVS